jgi:hypothetical protein
MFLESLVFFFNAAILWHASLHRVTHNMTLFIEFPEKYKFRKCCFKKLFLFWHLKQYLYTTCSELVFLGEFNEQSLVILWVNWFKNESFWHRFTCIKKNLDFLYCISTLWDTPCLSPLNFWNIECHLIFFQFQTRKKIDFETNSIFCRVQTWFLLPV